MAVAEHVLNVKSGKLNPIFIQSNINIPPAQQAVPCCPAVVFPKMRHRSHKTEKARDPR